MRRLLVLLGNCLSDKDLSWKISRDIWAGNGRKEKALMEQVAAKCRFKLRGRPEILALAILCLCLLLHSSPLRAYSVLSHEALIDAAWKSFIVPLLLSRYPNMTPAQLREAHAYAYGGCVIQDMGYYPLGNKYFQQADPLRAYR